jgi:acyl-coenzyme A synthetase/AMP-(fatty) acid ligase
MAVTWFRSPTDDDPGTLNACYDALDLHVIRGRADEVALTLGENEHTFAWLLTEVAACAGVLRAFGIGVGDRVVLGSVPAETAAIVVLAVARVGAVTAYDDSAGAAGPVVVREVDGGVVFSIDVEDVPWDVAMRAGRTDPAGTADVPGDAVLAVHGDDVLTVLDALGASDDHTPVVTAGATLVEVGGLHFWSFDTP